MSKLKRKRTRYVKKSEAISLSDKQYKSIQRDAALKSLSNFANKLVEEVEMFCIAIEDGEIASKCLDAETQLLKFCLD